MKMTFDISENHVKKRWMPLADGWYGSTRKHLRYVAKTFYENHFEWSYNTKLIDFVKEKYLFLQIIACSFSIVRLSENVKKKKRSDNG